MLNGYSNGHSEGGATSPLALLLVETDEVRAEGLELHLKEVVSELISTRCGSLASARDYLSGTAFDAVCTTDELPDGSGIALAEFCDVLGLRAPVFVRARPRPCGADAGEEHVSTEGPACYVLTDDDAGAAAAIGRALKGSGRRGAPPAVEGEAVQGEAVPEQWDRGEMAGMLQALRSETGAVAHAINNPLTVIAGNAQLLGELARLGALDATLLRPVEDIEEATQQLNEALGRLSALRQRIAASLGVSDGL